MREYWALQPFATRLRLALFPVEAVGLVLAVVGIVVGQRAGQVLLMAGLAIVSCVLLTSFVWTRAVRIRAWRARKLEKAQP